MSQSLESRIYKLLEQTTKARVFAAIVNLSTVYTDKNNSNQDVQKATKLHTRLLTTVRNPHIVRVSLQDLLDEIEGDYPVPLDMDIEWIVSKDCGLADFVNHQLVLKLSPGQ